MYNIAIYKDKNEDFFAKIFTEIKNEIESI
jgi:hypothetical protein